MKNMLDRKSCCWLGLFVVLGVTAFHAAGQTVDCASPNGTFPLAAAGHPEDCVGYSNVDINADGTVYWRVDGTMTSVCSSQLHVDYSAANNGLPNGVNAPVSGTNCGWYPAQPHGTIFNPPYGFRAPLSGLAQPGLGDFLSPSPTLGMSSASLVPSGMAGESTWWNDATRQTLHQAVDLVTGMPLAKVNQLELPFDGASFRLIRTRSGHRNDQRRFGHYDEYINDRMSAGERWWDWSGQGWMINENPVLLIDSAVPDIVGNNPKTTWLILDAHQSIPFQQIESTGIYAAPPRFRAKLTHNGNWDGPNRTWAADQEPTQMEVYLYDGALKYTFVVVSEDIPTHPWNKLAALNQDIDEVSSLHDRPYLPDQFGSGDQYNSWDPFNSCDNPGLGVPYLGLCVRIEDQYNHAVEINYSGIESKAVDYSDPTTALPEFEHLTDGNTCIECGQACTRKGLIRSVKLKTNDVTRWSLIYAYRGIRGDNTDINPLFFTNDESEFREHDLWGSYQIDRIYAYEVDVDAGKLDPEAAIIAQYGGAHNTFFLSVDQDQPLDLDGLGTDPLAELMQDSGNGISNDWTHLVQNHFIKKDADLEQVGDDGVWNNAVKIMTTVISRTFDEAEPTALPNESVKRWVYQYQKDASDVGEVLSTRGADSAYDERLRWLQRIYTPDDVANVLTATELGFNEAMTLANLTQMMRPGTDGESSANSLSDDGDRENPSELARVSSMASYRFEIGDHPAGSNSSGSWPSADGFQEAPNATTLSTSFLLNDKSRLMTDMDSGVVGTAVVPDEDGRVRYYQINRLAVSHTDFLDPAAIDANEFLTDPALVGPEDKQRSAFVHPYQWHGYVPPYSGGWSDGSTSQSPDLTAARWVTVIDEFADEADLYPTSGDIANGYGTYEGVNATKKTQLSRRIVELSPSGYLLRDRKWEFGEGGVVRSGGGLGEQFIYQTVEDYFADRNNSLPSGPTPPSNGAGNTRTGDRFSSIRNELLSVEYRSIGWSAGELETTPEDYSIAIENGYTRFTEYDVFHPGNESWADYDTVISEGLIPLSSRIQPVAEGFHRGSNYMPDSLNAGWDPSGNTNDHLYTNQALRNPEAPTDVLAQFEFIEPTTQLLAVLPDADYTVPPPTSYRVLRTRIDRDNSGDHADLPEEERPVLSRMMVGVPRQVYPDSPWYYPVEREFYDDKGNPVWSCTGQLKNPENPSASSGTDPYESLTFTYFVRDDEGRSLETVLDAQAEAMVSSSNPNVDDFMIDAWPTDTDGSGNLWSRIGSDPALSFVTSFVYDRYAPGLCDIFYPNGRRWARRIVTLTDASEYNAYMDEYAREFIYNNLELRDIGGGTLRWVTTTEGVVKDYRNTDVSLPPFVTRNVTFKGDLPYSTGNNANLRVTPIVQPEWILKSAIELGADSNGRIQKASLLERSPSGALLAVGSKEVNDLGELYREQEIDETITVQTRNSIGQTMRVYQGTEDRQWYLPPSAWDGIPSPNMILLERSEYGSGINDAWLPTVIRQYDETPSWAVSNLHDEAPVVDTQGQATLIHYDWRNRAVRTDVYEEGDPNDAATRRLSTSLVYLDYLDRPYLEVTYGSDPVGATAGNMLVIPANLDPSTYLEIHSFPELGGNEPDVGQLYSLSGFDPQSITQSIYSIDGTLIERRSYDTSWDGLGTPTYLADYSYNGRGGNRIFSQSPGGSIEVTHLDSVGRVSSTIMMVPSTDVYSGTNTPVGLVERARTDFVYDTDGNVIETARWERVDDGGVVLEGTNAVRTRTVNWYDVHKRLIATAELGTESASNEYQFDPAVSLYVHSVPGPGDDVSLFSVPQWDASTSAVVDLGSLPQTALVRVYEYDENGNKTLSVDPEGIATRYEYTASNRLMYKTENAAAADWADKRMTGYKYEYGRLVEMNLVTTDVRDDPNTVLAPLQTGDVPVWDGLDPDDLIEFGLNFAHRTRLEYGAEIVRFVGDGYTVDSYNNKLIGAMHLPNEQTGDPADDADVILMYTYSGQIALRFNSAGEAFKYIYDDLGRLISVEAGTWDQNIAPVFVGIDPTIIPGGLSIPEPTDKIRYIEYTYDDRGNLSDVHAWTERNPVNRIQISHTRMDYDERDRLITEWQQHGEGVIDASTPSVDYSWEYEATDLGSGGAGTARTGHSRVTSMEYPVPDLAINRRLITMDYGVDGSDEDLMSRLSGMQSNIGTASLASFEYTGSGRRSVLRLKGGKIVNDKRDTTADVGLIGVDMFGRSNRVQFRSTVGALNTLYRADYTFDKVGNRIGARITQADVGGVTRDNIRSVVNVYDDLHRLVGSEVGAIDESMGTDPLNPQIALGTTKHNDSWSLDRLGNWTGLVDSATGDITTYGRTTTGSFDDFGVPWSLSTHDQYNEYDFRINQKVTQRDSITQLSMFEMYEQDAMTEATGTIDPVYDGAGRTLFDGEYGYQYDAWGRVVQINKATADYDGGGVQVGYTLDLNMTKHFVYDGFGRLIRTTSPVPDPETSTGTVRAISFFYDGARRIQEVVSDNVASLALAQSSGDSGLQGLAEESTNLSNPDGTSAPLNLGKGQIPDPSGRNILREYVWGPGDNGPDELLLQTGELDDEYWCLVDGGGDLVALVEVQGTSVYVVRQWTYDAYGAVLTAEHLGASLESHVGHKGLFVDRLDVGVGDGTGAESPRLVPYAHTLYQNRNRSYSPSLGRFLQMDPNQTAMALLSTTASHGQGIGAISIAFSMEGMYGDGLNLYQYLGSNPWTNSDPLGLSSDPFAEIDAIIDEHIASVSAFASALGAELASKAIIAARIASYLPIPGLGLAGDLALVALGDHTMEAALMGAAIGIVPGGKLIKLLGKSGIFKGIGRIGAAAFKSAKGYAAKGGAFLRRGAMGIVNRAKRLLNRKPNSVACGCFTTATLVWTANGAVPIGEIEEGQQVYAAVDDGLSQDYSSNEVGTKIIIGEASLVQLVVLHEDGSTETINTTDEHPFHVTDTNVWTRADQLLIGDQLSTISGTTELQGVIYTTERVPVYNLSIPGSPTYYVGEHGVWVHNCWTGNHHFIPKYLGGLADPAADGFVFLQHVDHVLIHSLLDKASKARGIPARTQGAKKVDDWLRTDPMNNIHELREALVEAYGAYDIQKGTSLLPDLMSQMSKQGF